MKDISFIVLAFIFLSSCEKDQSEIDDKIIREYLAENNLEAEFHTSGLYYSILNEGSGGHPDIYSTVEVRYKGYLTSDQVFDQTSGDNTIEFPLSNLITGWQIGIPLLQKGGKGIFYLPSSLGYGARQAGSIPPNSVLIFEIELVDFY